MSTSYCGTPPTLAPAAAAATEEAVVRGRSAVRSEARRSCEEEVGIGMAPVRELTAAALLGALGGLQVSVAQVQLPGWNDTFCHSPDTVLPGGGDCT